MNKDRIGLVKDVEDIKKDIAMANKLYELAFWLTIVTLCVFLLIGSF